MQTISIAPLRVFLGSPSLIDFRANCFNWREKINFAESQLCRKRQDVSLNVTCPRHKRAASVEDKITKRNRLRIASLSKMQQGRKLVATLLVVNATQVAWQS
jgi:hypothetical protein